jgi:hypothetical protein
VDRRAAQLASIAIGLLLLGCSSCRSTKAIASPEELIAKYLHAVEKADARAVWALLDEKIRSELTEADFVSSFTKYRAELLDRARLLKARVKEPAGIKAKVTYPSGLEADLVYTDGWRLEGSLATPTRTPQETLSALLLAAEQRNLSALMRLLSKSARSSVEQFLRDRIEKLHKALDQEIEVNGNRARVRLDPRSKIDLILEDGQWRILEVE